MDEEDKQMLREVHTMLKELLSYVYSDEYDMKQFCVNVAADIYVEEMEEKRKNELKNNFKK